MISGRIKSLREQQKMTQAELAAILNITRSCVNAWEMGISVPSTQSVVELANTFHVSTDYLLCMETGVTIDLSGLSEADMEIVSTLVSQLRRRNENAAQ